MRGRTIAFVLAALVSVASAGCGASQPRVTAPGGAVTADRTLARTDPASRRCIRKVKVAGGSFASGNHPAARRAHDWGTTLSCPRSGGAVGPW